MASKKKDLISLLEFSTEEIQNILSIARQVKKERLKTDTTIFKNKSGVMIFEKPSLRTRITFETAINELGGHPINLSADAIGMGKRESVADIARNLERWVHLIIARTYSHATVEKLASFSSIPVVNALTDQFHPCQALAFAQTMLEKTADQKKVKTVFVGDGNNVCNSIMVLSAKLGFNFTVVCPKEYAPPGKLVEECRGIGRNNGSEISVTQDIFTAVNDATFLYTDVWTSMGQENETERRRKDFERFQINQHVISHAPPEVFVSHCLPAHRGEEITSDVLDSDRSVAFDEAENRLHVQKAVIVHLFS
jgi:ornithine carbamoyltransferase